MSNGKTNGGVRDNSGTTGDKGTNASYPGSPTAEQPTPTREPIASGDGGGSKVSTGAIERDATKPGEQDRRPEGEPRERHRGKSQRRAEAQARRESRTPGTSAASEDRTGATETGARNASKEDAQRTPESLPGRKPPVAPRKVTHLPRAQSTDELTQEVVKEGFRMLYQMPALAGYGQWWELQESEAQALAEPTARLLKRMSPKAQETFSRFFDPIALAFTAVVITMPRIEMTRGAQMAARLKMETEGRLRNDLSGRRPAERVARSDGAISQSNSKPPATSATVRNGEDGSSRSSESVKDAFD